MKTRKTDTGNNLDGTRDGQSQPPAKRRVVLSTDGNLMLELDGDLEKHPEFWQTRNLKFLETPAPNMSFNYTNKDRFFIAEIYDFLTKLKQLNIQFVTIEYGDPYGSSSYPIRLSAKTRLGKVALTITPVTPPR